MRRSAASWSIAPLRLLFVLVAIAPSSLSITGSVSADPLAWSRWPMPDPRTHHVAIFDPTRNELVIHGGSALGPDGDSDALWSLSLGGVPQWRWRDYGLHSGMSPRDYHVAVYDPPGDRMIVFGGRVDGTNVNDSWALSLATSTWTPYGSGTKPNDTFNHAAAFDGLRRRMIVLSVLGGVFALDLATGTWSSVATGGSPPQTEFASAAYDAVRDRVIAVDPSAIWQLTLAGTPTWSPLVPTGSPPPALDGGIVYDPVRDRVEMVRPDGSVWALAMTDPPAWSQLSSAPLPPGPRDGTPVVYDSVGDRLLFHGGQTFNDTWAFSLGSNAWTQIEAGNTIPIRALHSAVVAPPWDALVIFGGQFGPGNDTWRFALDGSGFTPVTTAGTPPSGRSGPASIYDPVRQRMLSFGGQSGSTYLNDTYALTVTGSPTWSPIATSGTAPAPRSGSQAIYDPVRDRMVVFGGTNDGNSTFRDAWALSLAGAPAWSPIGEGNAANCTVPGPAVVTDPVGDVKANGRPAQDLVSIHIAEPHFADLVERAVFTMRLAALDPTAPPRRSVWRTYFDDTTGTDTTFFVGMTTCPKETGVTFQFGYVDASANNLDRVLGSPEAGVLLPNGDIQITMRKSQVGSASGVGAVRWFIPLSASLPRVQAAVRLTMGNNCSDGATLDASGIGTYVVTGNCPVASTLPELYPSAAVYDSRRDRLIVIGAELSPNGLTRAWALPFAGTQAWMPLAGGATVPQRYYFAAAYDSLNDRVLAYGGASDNFTSTLDILFSLSLSPTESWSSITPSGYQPLPRLEHTLVRDAARGHFVLYGGLETLADPLKAWGSPAVWFLADQAVGPVTARAAHAAPERRAAELTVVEPGLALSACRMVDPDRIELEYRLPAAGEVTIDVLDVQGRRLAHSLARVAGPGSGAASVQLSRAPASGLYLVRLRLGERTAYRKLLVIR